MAIETQHLLSFSRVVIGGLVLSDLWDSPESWMVLPAVALACVLDYGDGYVARSRDAASATGRLIDNLCDAAFLAMSFVAFARIGVWSDPVSGSATRYWEHANWLPALMLVASFGSYMLRWAVCARRGRELAPSLRGHSAGVFNYVLALLGGVAVLPGFDVTPWVLEPAFVTVALLNATALSDNVLLLATALRR